jgi:hypothetical protein
MPPNNTGRFSDSQTSDNSETPPSNPAPSLPSIDSSLPASSPKPARLAGKRSKKPLLLLVFMLVMFGGSAAAYFGLIAPLQAGNLLKDAVTNSLEKNEGRMTGSLKMDIARGDGSDERQAVDIDFDIQSDIEAQAFNYDLELVTSGVNVPLVLRSVDKDVYVKLAELGSLTGAAQLANPLFGSLAAEADKRLANQWILIDNTLIRQAKAECVLEILTSRFSPGDLQSEVESYTNEQYATLKSTAQETMDGRETVRYNLTASNEQLKRSRSQLKEYDLYNRIRDCAERISGDSNTISEFEKELEKKGDDNETATVSIWADKKQRLVTRAEFTATDSDGTVELKTDFNYDPVNVEKPSGAKPLLQLIGEFQELLKAKSRR